MNCRYMCQSLLEWMLNNKIIVFLSLLSFCLFVSTLALAGQRNRLSNELNECNAASTTDTTESSTTLGEATSAPSEATSAASEATSAASEVTSDPSEATSDATSPGETPATQAAVIESALVRENDEVHEVSENEEQSNSVRNALRSYGLLTKLIAS
ncbi:hypothetical protein EVAR_80071_1 [Eumeta japonica]|uniref:Uncharacterized protein n=1 Tax=Eumeta variegata TaxID=151549 RepID=A0A4C1UCW7_EUMVA|nr:hypothetical protein EVAR_80071_1 [Eumeta japonica]